MSIPTFGSTTVVSKVNNWIVFQQRLDGRVPFNRSWPEYKSGFGIFNGDFWLGLEKLHQLTLTSRYKLRFELYLVNGIWISAEYDGFSVSSEADFYRIYVSGYSGDSGDVMNAPTDNQKHNGMPFSTYDRDQDAAEGYNCAAVNQGGWWYNKCYWINVNGLYGSVSYGVHLATDWRLLSASRMMMKLL